MDFLKKNAFLVALCLLFSLQAQSQIWLPRLGVATDSLTFASDSARLDYLFRSKTLLVSANNDLKLNLLPFIIIYQPDTKTKITAPRLLSAEEKLFAQAEKNYRLPSAIEAQKALKSKNLEDIRKAYAQNPNNAKYTWSEVPEPYKNITERRKANSKRDLKAISKEINTRQEFDNALRQLPKKKESAWKFKGEQNVQLSQLYLSNWTKGGESSASLLFDFRASLLYKHDKHQWETNGLHKLGLTRTTTLGTRISDDALEFTSKYGYQAVSKWYYSFQASFKTQIFKSYDKNDAEKQTPLSAFLSPAYVSLIVGMDFNKNNLSILLSPYTADLNIVADTVTISRERYKIPEGSRLRVENGLSVNAKWKKEIFLGIIYSTRAELFFPYRSKEAQKKLDWENIIDMQINRWLSTRFLLNLRYFDNESDKLQLKENFSISFKMAFG